MRTRRPEATSGSTIIGNGNEHGGGKLRARIDHQGDRADEEKEIAQGERRRGAEGRLHLGRIGGQPGEEFAGSRGIVKFRVERAKMLEHIGPEVGHDAFAERRHEIKPRSRRESENRGDGDQPEKISIDQARALSRKAEIDHAPDGQRHRQGCRRRHRHGDQRSGNARLIAQKIGRELQKRARRRFLLGTGGFRCEGRQISFMLRL